MAAENIMDSTRQFVMDELRNNKASYYPSAFMSYLEYGIGEPMELPRIFTPAAWLKEAEERVMKSLHSEPLEMILEEDIPGLIVDLGNETYLAAEAVLGEIEQSFSAYAPPARAQLFRAAMQQMAQLLDIHDGDLGAIEDHTSIVLDVARKLGMRAEGSDPSQDAPPSPAASAPDAEPPFPSIWEADIPVPHADPDGDPLNFTPRDDSDFDIEMFPVDDAGAPPSAPTVAKASYRG
jgi:hypothetical protein